MVLEGPIEDYGFTLRRDLTAELARMHAARPASFEQFLDIVRLGLGGVVRDERLQHLCFLSQNLYRPEEIDAFDRDTISDGMDLAILEATLTIRLQALAESLGPGVKAWALAPEEVRVAGLGPRPGYLVAHPGPGADLLAHLGFTDAERRWALSHEALLDYRPFAHLWETPLTSEEFKAAHEADEARTRRIEQLANCLGSLHSKGVLPDTHEDNFVGGVLVDLDGMIMCLTEPPPEACARNLIPLIAQFAPWEWMGFKGIYRAMRGASGDWVVNLIEHGHEMRWKYALHHGMFTTAAAELEEALADPDPWTDHELPGMYSELGVLRVRLGDHTGAVHAYQSGAEYVEPHDTRSRAAFLFNIAKAWARAGDREQARSAWTEFRSLDLTSLERGEYRRLMDDARHVADALDD